MVERIPRRHTHQEILSSALSTMEQGKKKNIRRVVRAITGHCGLKKTPYQNGSVTESKVYLWSGAGLSHYL